jgi:thioredoxin-dependent peroxiredoxin
MALTDRIGEAFEFGEQLTITGAKLQPGDPAPAFTLEYFDSASQSMRTISLADTAGHVRLLNVINSLDTPICHLETRRWENLRVDLPPDVTVYTISMDLPFAQARWRTAEGVTHESLSAHKDEGFGRDYGVLIKEWRLLQRAIFVIDRDDTITYADYVADQMLEPDYDAAIAALRATVESNQGEPESCNA